MARSILDSAGIQHFVTNEHLLSSYSVGFGPIEIKVSSDQAQEARELLMELIEPDKEE